MNINLNKRTGNLDIGLSYFQEEQWISAIKRYGKNIMDKSLLSSGQKIVLIAEEKYRRKKNPLTNNERQEIKNWANTQYAISYKYRDTDPKRAEFYYGRSVGMGKIAQVYNPLKSLGRISRKSQTLQKHYREEVKSKGYHENMGDKYMREFEKYVGDPYDYSYRDRLSLYGIRANLFNYVISPVQNPLSQKGNIAQRYNPSLKRFYKVNLNNGDVVMVFSERELVSLLARANIKSEYTSPFPKITGVRLATFPEIEWVKKSGEPVVRLNPLSRKKKNPVGVSNPVRNMPDIFNVSKECRDYMWKRRMVV